MRTTRRGLFGMLAAVPALGTVEGIPSRSFPWEEQEHQRMEAEFRVAVESWQEKVRGGAPYGQVQFPFHQHPDHDMAPRHIREVLGEKGLHFDVYNDSGEFGWITVYLR